MDTSRSIFLPAENKSQRSLRPRPLKQALGQASGRCRVAVNTYSECVSGRGPAIHTLFDLTHRSRVACLIGHNEDRGIFVDLGHGARGHPLMNLIEKSTARGFDQRQRFAVPSTKIAEENFCPSVVLSCGRQALRTVQPTIGKRRGESGKEEQQSGHPSDPGTAYRRGGGWGGNGAPWGWGRRKG